MSSTTSGSAMSHTRGMYRWIRRGAKLKYVAMTVSAVARPSGAERNAKYRSAHSSRSKPIAANRSTASGAVIGSRTSAERLCDLTGDCWARTMRPWVLRDRDRRVSGRGLRCAAWRSTITPGCSSTATTSWVRPPMAGGADPPAAVRRLLARLQCYASTTTARVELVLDVRQPDLPEGDHDGVVVRYATRARRDAADDRIVELLGDDPRADNQDVEVVTSDRALRERVRERGARVVGAGAFLTRLSDAGCLRSVARDLAPRRVGVEAGLAWEAEHALAHDVLLDLGGAAGDGAAGRARRTPARGRGCVVAPSRASRCTGCTASRRRPSRRRRSRSRPGRTRPDSSLSTEPSGPGTPFSRLRLRAQAAEAEQLGVDPEPDQRVAARR